MAGISDSIRHKFQRMLEESPHAYARLKGYLVHKDAKDENYKWAIEFIHERAFGKAPQFNQVEVNDITQRRSIEEVNSAIKYAEDIAKRTGLDTGE